MAVFPVLQYEQSPLIPPFSPFSGLPSGDTLKMATPDFIALCVPETFSFSLFGTEILDISTQLVTNFSTFIPETLRLTDPDITIEDATFCNVTVSYTHPGQGDRVNTEAWLPADWNGRLHAVGGGGYSPGRNELSFPHMSGAMADGYIAISTDGGLVGNSQIAAPWALLSPGNVDLYSLRNLGSITLNETAFMGKALAEDFYGMRPRYSYYTGCSNGGRQGLMLAQRYPTAYDGITACAPAFNWTHLLPHIYWGKQVLTNLGDVPNECEIDTISDTALSACDGLDGVTDGIVGNVDECFSTFDPSSLVGKPCAGNTTGIISQTAATLVKSLWRGYETEAGIVQFPGVSPGADITSHRPDSNGLLPLLNTVCSGNGTCTAPVQVLVEVWYRLFGLKDSTATVDNFTHQQFDDLTYSSRQEYSSLIDTTDTDLSRFKAAGGKMISYHGLNDALIPPKSTEQYYKSVTALDPQVHDYYRFYKVPGLSHCFFGPSKQPTSLFSQLRAWVENGTAPESSPIQVDALGEVHDRIICPFPQVAELTACEDASRAECWVCT